MKLIHLSDLHFHQNNKDNQEAVTMLAYIKEHYPNHYLVITGDIVDDGHEKQYKCAFNALKEFQDQIFICPGNHDFGAAGNFYSQERAERFDEYLSVPLKQGGTFTGDKTPVVNIFKEKKQQTMLIALDTNLETEQPFDFACGAVGEKQLAFLNTILSSPVNKNIIKILFFHHHPFMHNNPFMELKDGLNLIRTIFSRVDAVLFGHKHESKLFKNINGIPFILASDNSPGKEFARELTIENNNIKVNDIKICDVS